jgi:hypothetical protein
MLSGQLHSNRGFLKWLSYFFKETPFLHNYTDSTQKNTQDIKELKEKIKVKEARPSIKKGNNEIAIRKAVMNPNFTTKTVLTDSTVTAGI